MNPSLATPPLTPSGALPSPAQRFTLFTEGLKIVFSRWTALRLALDNQWAGIHTEKVIQDLMDEVVEFFQTYGSQVYADEIRDNLEQFFAEVMNVDLEDGSPAQIGKSLVDLYRSLMVEGSLEMLNRLRELSMKSTSGQSQSRRAGGDDDDDSSEEEEEGDDYEGSSMDVDMEGSSSSEQQPPAPIEPVFDEDGFELVQKKGRRRR